MTAIAEKLSTHYGKTITVARTYYANSVLVNAAVAAGEDIDMSEPYYYLSGCVTIHTRTLPVLPAAVPAA